LGPITSHPSVRTQSILFLCEDNYYRSRYAEEFLNHRAELLGMPWRAVSKGLDESCNEFSHSSCIHPKVFEFAESKGVQILGSNRFPVRVEDTDFHDHNRVIVLNEVEHRPLLEANFPLPRDQVEYWNIRNLEVWTADRALGELEECLHKLTAELIDA
jgi:protein-tyrosine-phosphatase